MRFFGRELRWPPGFNREEAAKVIQNLLDGTETFGPWEWDDFITVPVPHDPYLDMLREGCNALRELYPPEPGDQAYCNQEGMAVLRGFLDDLRHHAAETRTGS